jgi:hypothetical protein
MSTGSRLGDLPEAAVASHIVADMYGTKGAPSHRLHAGHNRHAEISLECFDDAYARHRGARYPQAVSISCGNEGVFGTLAQRQQWKQRRPVPGAA